MHNIGLDFGTTYSFISQLKDIERDENGRVNSYSGPELCLFSPTDGASTVYDSLVVKSGDWTGYGPMARDAVYGADCVYRGFKMMLAENDEEILSSRGYSDMVKPENIVHDFLYELLHKHCEVYNIEKIDKIVMGVPYVWFENYETNHSRTILSKIVSSFDLVGQVDLVSEPAAACAYCIENYKKAKKKDHEGYILVIDYGGGTLDIALCEVKGNGQHSEVIVKKSCGAGTVAKSKDGGHQIGKAGVAFIDAVIKIAIKQYIPDISDDEIINHKEYGILFNEIEAQLKRTDTSTVFKKKETNTQRETLTDSFTRPLNIYGQTRVVITYGMLAEAFNDVIQPVLSEKISQIIDYMNGDDENNPFIPWKPGNGATFQIAMVGGFCGFFLTRDAIKLMLRSPRGRGEDRFEIPLNGMEAEYAISHGAALIAEDVVGFKQTAPYHLGVVDVDDSCYFIVKKGEEFDIGKPIFPENGPVFSGGGIAKLVINKTDDCIPEYNEILEPREEYVEKLKLGIEGYYELGFSFDRSTILTLHKRRHDTNDPMILAVEQPEPVILDEIYKIAKTGIQVVGKQEANSR